MRQTIQIVQATFFCFCLCLVFSGAGHAAGSGGFRVELPDAGAMGKGSAFVGEANRASAVYYNPAGLTQLKGKNHVMIGNTVLQPLVEHESFSGTKTEMREQIFNVPHAYVVSDFGLEKWSFGFGSLSSWGLGTRWADDSFSKYVATKTDLTNIDTMFTAAYGVTDRLSMAVSLDYDFSKVNKKKKLLQSGGSDGEFQAKGEDGGLGYRLATHYKFNDRHSLGLMYRSAIDLKYKGKLFLNNLNASGLNYAAIFGGSSYSTDIESKLTLPQSVVMGYSFRPTEKWVFNFDVEWMDWSSVEHEKLDYPNETDATRLSVLNSGNPVSRDWRSVMSFAIGTEYALNDKWRLRGGYYHHEAPIDNTNWESNIPDADSHGITAGFGYDINESLTLDMAYSAFIYENRTIDNSVGSATGASVDGEYGQMMNIMLLTLNYVF